MTMTSSRPYIIRALYDWILENQCTPYVLVDAFGKGVEVPQEHVKDGQIVLNISPTAVQSILIANEGMEFDGRFGGIPKKVLVPIRSILGIYAKENGQGMMFESDDPPDPPDPPKGPGDTKKEDLVPIRAQKPSLKIVK
tara:strand:- start:414 stop:830 length:417 start_codon:yes stop_codon:yes gene_type:complete